jgi:hypothetical protein
VGEQLARRDLPATGQHILAMNCKEQVHHGTLPCRTRWRSGRALKRHGARSNKVADEKKKSTLEALLSALSIMRWKAGDRRAD